MPNTKPPITTVERAVEYHNLLNSAKGASSIDIVNVLYLTDNTTVDTVLEMKKHPFIVGFKYYPAGATTNSDAGVTDFRKCYDVFEKVQELGLVLCIHSEVSRLEIDIFDREKVFIEEVRTDGERSDSCLSITTITNNLILVASLLTPQVIRPLVTDFPKLKIVMEHISTSFGADFINSLPEGSPVVGSITPHHIMYNRNALLVGGVKPHFYCLPILKRESHRVALLNAATSRNGRFITGTDSAPHTVESKESACGCAGVFNGHCAVEMYVEAFEGVGKLDALEGFFEAGKRFYGIEDGGRTMNLVKEDWEVPETMDLGDDLVKPLRAGEKMKWKIVR